MIKGAPVDLTGFLFGDVFAVTGTDIAIDLHRRRRRARRRRLAVAAAAAPCRARGAGRRRGRRPARRVRTVFIVLLAVTIAVAMKIVGILLVMAFLVVPAVAARPLARTPERMVAVNRPDRRRQRRRRPGAVGHSRQSRRPVDRHRHVDAGRPLVELGRLRAPRRRGRCSGGRRPLAKMRALD